MNKDKKETTGRSVEKSGPNAVKRMIEIRKNNNREGEGVERLPGSPRAVRPKGRKEPGRNTIAGGKGSRGSAQTR